MTIRYSVEQRGDLLCFVGEGVEEGLEQNKQIHQMIVQACNKHDCTKVLIDDRQVKYTASFTSLYELAKSYSQIHLPRKVEKVAVVASPEYKETNDFFEDTTRNRGVNLRVFSLVEDAQAWLSDEAG